MRNLLLAFFIGSALCGLTLAQKSRIVTAAQANGTYRSRSSEIRILALGNNKLKVQFDLTYEYQSPAGRSANLGSASGEATIENNVAVFVPQEYQKCKITMTFLPDGKLKVEQQGNDFDCGFGHNVTADGTYRKISRRKPQFDENH